MCWRLAKRDVMGVSKATADSSAALRNDKKKSERQQEEVRSVIEVLLRG
jgi:hypothetical protein